MPNQFSEVVKNKLTKLRGILGDDAVNKVLADAENREQAAQSVGLEFKEKSGEPQKLSHILAQVDTALESGAIVNDLDETEPEAPKTPAPAKLDTAELVKEIIVAVNTATKETVTAQFKEFLAGLETKEAEKPTDPKVTAVQTALKEAEENQKKLKAQLDELLGSQPKNGAGFKASADETTLLKPEDQALRTGPGPDPLNAFVSDFVMGMKPNGNQP